MNKRVIRAANQPPGKERDHCEMGRKTSTISFCLYTLRAGLYLCGIKCEANFCALSVAANCNTFMEVILLI